MNYVIIGNSIAATGAIEAIRKTDKDGTITVIGDEPYTAYGRPLISYLLQGRTTRDKMSYRPSDFYMKNKCKVMLGKTVEKIIPKEKRILISDGQELPYDKLLVSTGSSPFVPPMDGMDNILYKTAFIKMDDALYLQNHINENSRVLIVGAGLIGLKCAEGIAQRVKSITIVDMAPRILSSILDETCAKMIQNHLEQKNMTFYLNDCVSSFSKSEAKLKSGAVIPYDIVVMAVGVRPNVSLVKEAGGTVKRGILTDSSMRTSIPDVFAAGDCTEGYDSSIEENRILALLPNAYQQGECAGYVMAGANKSYEEAIPMNAIGFFGLHIATAGIYTGTLYERTGDGTLKRLYYENDRLRGYIMIGDIDKAGIYTGLIRKKTPLSSIDFDLICEKPGLMAFSREDREERLNVICTQ